ncbi:tubulin epsilon and delta complex protein 1-like [Leptopilina heterotoma]|uniref:tubulin epsilon and delta complex protein 1-like n=1 Tax=Leptopilina heterotoma TaxID=63436 RepID=UPI001CA917A8|nr:tubulin epsilon and delta complex protein 1-like [Leptopilina heterotoma]
MDTKTVIELLCKHLTCLTEISMEPDYFRLAKYNKSSPEAIEAFWSVLYILSTCSILEENKFISFKNYDKITSTKLNFAFLQYKTVEFYLIPENDVYNSRELLLALGWLLASNNVIEKKLKSNLVNCSLGQECSSSEILSQALKEEIDCSTLENEMKQIVHVCSKLNHNLKEISELLGEKVKLTTKVHAASINTSGLTHLSVFEMALIKRLTLDNKSPQDHELIKNLQNISKMIDFHLKWTKRQHIFYDWMTTVIDESMSSQKSIYTEEFRQELMKFIIILRQLVKRKMHNFENDEISNFSLTPNCTSRLLRIQNSETETETWLKQINDDLIETEKEVEINEKNLLKELKLMLKLIQNCIRV